VVTQAGIFVPTATICIRTVGKSFRTSNYQQS
jgi:hypothetical protein